MSLDTDVLIAGILLVSGSLMYASWCAQLGAQAAGRTFGHFVVVMAFLGLVTLGIVFGFEGQTRLRVAGGAMWLLDLVGLLNIGWYLSSLSASGDAILVLPRTSRHGMALLAALFELLNVAIQISRSSAITDSLGPAAHSLVVGSLASLILYVVHLTCASLIPFQLREAGAAFGTFIPWSGLRRYAWEGPAGETLTLWRRRTALTWFLMLSPSVSMRIPASQRERLDEILRRYLPREGAPHEPTSALSHAS